ncbi:unnamed protein product, partial [Allacma fusca]
MKSPKSLYTQAVGCVVVFFKNPETFAWIYNLNPKMLPKTIAEDIQENFYFYFAEAIDRYVTTYYLNENLVLNTYKKFVSVEEIISLFKPNKAVILDPQKLFQIVAGAKKHLKHPNPLGEKFCVYFD